MMALIPEELMATVVFMAGLVIGSAFGLFLGLLRSQDAAVLRGRNIERRAHGEDLLEPAPTFDLHHHPIPGGPIS